MSAELPSTEQIFTETSRLVPLFQDAIWKFSEVRMYFRSKTCLQFVLEAK